MSTSDKLFQKNIKNENTRAIFCAIAGVSGISRAEISEKTGLSLMTVGKVADILVKEEYITQAKPAREMAGRRAGMLTVADNHFIFVIDISGDVCRASVLNLKLETIDSMSYPYNDSLFPEDNLMIFLRESGTLLFRNLATKKLIGTGVCVASAVKDGKNISKYSILNENITEIVRNAIGIIPDVVMNRMEAAAIFELEGLAPELKGCTISLQIGKKIDGCIAIDGKIIERPSDFGNLICANGKTLSENLIAGTNIFDEEEMCRQLAFALRPIITVLAPSAVFISRYGEKGFSEWFAKLLRFELEKFCVAPEIFLESGRTARCDMGVGMILRDKMINKL
ncbi:MAG: hypothetical protein U0M06_08635 [Clostridia bacterium]|nr:hypothetical protein [Clostridia bacterium]